MDNKKAPFISVILPVYNGETTITKTLDSLFSQSVKFDELIVINDASCDASRELLEKYLSGKTDCRMIGHTKNFGLAKTYNEAVRQAKGDLIILLHQDVVLLPEALAELIKPFKDEKVVAAGHNVICPYDVWLKYNFWQKCFFSRFVGKNSSGVNGQADCFRKDALMKVGLFNDKRYRTAGEDGDMIYKLKKIGKVVDSNAKIIHLHKISPNFSFQDIIYKQKQYSESRGVLLRTGRITSFGNFIGTFFRELLLIFLVIPYSSYLSAILIVVYSFWYTKLVYLKEYKNPRILILPLLNIYLLFVSFAYTLKGYFLKKQSI
jgi:glycosyltransferase involved in cell wall biosynthesis